MTVSDEIRARYEESEQVAVFEWAELARAEFPELEYLNASLNGVRLPIGLAVKAKRLGMRKGHPDLNLPVPRHGYHGLYIEMKPITRGKKEPKKPRLEKDQRRWRDFLIIQGYCCLKCHGKDEAINIITNYLGGGCDAHTR